MLQLILGTSGTGKTTALLEEIRRRAEAGERSFYLVPEQFSQSAELLLYDALGDRLSAFAEAVSFRTLAERIEREYGGRTLPVLTEAGRCVFVRRAIAQLGDSVRYYRRHRGSAAFVAQCAAAIEELKTAGASAQQLADAAAAADSEKLSELALIYAAAEAAAAGKAIDPSDRITRAADRLGEGLFAGCWFYLDDFDGFTAPEYALLRALLPASAGVTAALCCDGLDDRQGGYGLFSPVKKTAARLIRLAGAQGVPVGTPRRLGRDLRAGMGGLAAVDDYFTGRLDPDGELPRDGVTVDLVADREEEALRIAAALRSLARSGVRYSEMAVVCRSLDPLAPLLADALDRQQVPYFLDRSATAEYTAPTAFLRAALGLARGGLSGRGLLALLKSGLCGLPAEGIAAFENYLFTWQPTAEELRAPFTLNPAGLGAEMGEEESAQLALAESVRAALLGPVEQFWQHTRRPTGLSLSRALYYLMDAFDAAGQMTALAGRIGDEQGAEAAEDALRSWDAAMDALDEMARLLGEDPITPAEYDELLVLLVRGSELGRVPRTVDSVLVTTADRMRLFGPRQVFVADLAEGIFPAGVGASGLLTHADRALLVEAGVDMPGGFDNRVLLEQMYLYRALTAPCEGLHLLCPQQASGAPLLPSAPLAALMRLLDPPPMPLTPAMLWSAPAAALAGAAARWRVDDGTTAALTAALAEEGGQEAGLALLRRAEGGSRFSVEDTAALRRLLGGRLTLSPTRIERYYSCSYAYFLEYVLHLRPRRRAQLSPIESGSFVHYVLENALRRAGEGFLSMSEEELRALADALCSEYLNEKIPPTLSRGTRFRYLVDRIRQNTGRLLCFLQQEQRQSSFHPVAFELPIGPDSAVRPLRLTAPGGQQVQVVGKIDRVDVMQREGQRYLRVVDYKTGAKEFSLEEVWCGLNLQMLLYLFSLCGKGGGPFAGSIPAGVLYLSADPPPPLLERQQAAEYRQAYAVDGLVLEDEMVLRAMDREGTGAFIPVSRTSNGKLRRSKKLADLEKMGRIEQRIETLVGQMAEELYDGLIDASPLVRRNERPCDWCDYRTVCRHRAGRRERQLAAPQDAFEQKEAQGAPEEGGAAGARSKKTPAPAAWAKERDAAPADTKTAAERDAGRVRGGRAAPAAQVTAESGEERGADGKLDSEPAQRD